MRRKPDTSSPSSSPSASSPRARIALVLQGGGALGAYQAGVYQAMHEHDLTPDWVVGTSIGAINAAIIAGNRREDRIPRLRAFWESVSHADAIDLRAVPDATRQLMTWASTMDTFARGVPGFFTPRQFNPFAGSRCLRSPPFLTPSYRHPQSPPACISPFGIDVVQAMRIRPVTSRS